MKRRVATAVGVLLAATAATSAAAPDLDKIVRLWAAATGGLPRIHALNSVRMTGRISLGDAGPRPIVVEVARPGRLRTEIVFSEGIYIQTFDGKNGWKISPFQKSVEPVAMSAEEAANAPEQADIDGPLVDSDKKGIRLALEGVEKVDGWDAHRIRVTRRDGIVRYIDLDSVTSLKVRWEGELGAEGQRAMNASVFSDYRTVDGLSFPFRIVSGVAGRKASQEIVFEKIEANPAIPESRFQRPK